MSYRPRVRVGEMRYFNVLTFHVKPGHETEFLEGSKAISAAHEKANMDEHWSAYQVVSGAPSGTFLVFIPMKSMSDLDASQTMHGKAYEDSIGEESQKKIRDAQRESIASADNRLFAFSPEMSHVPPPMAAVDPTFWNPKPPAPEAGAKRTKAAPEKKEK